MSGPFRAYDPQELDELAVPLLRAILAMVEFAKHVHDELDPLLLEAAVAKGFLTGLAGFIAHPHTDDEQDEELIAGFVAFLWTTVAELRAS